MAYRRSRTNIRRPVRRRRVARRTAVRRRPMMMRRRRTYRQRAAAANCSCPKELSPGDKFVMIQSDPFDTKFFGAKVPDSSTLPSISTPLQYNVALSSPAVTGDNPSFCHAWAFYPGVRGAFVTAQGTNTSAWDWGAVGASVVNAPQVNSFTSQFEAYRPTAHAIRLSCPFAPTSTTGFVHIAIATETVYNGNTPRAQYLNLANNLADFSGYTFYKRVTLASLTQSPITLINKWTDETAFRYQSPNAQDTIETLANALTFQIPWSWGTLLVAVEGASTVTTAGQVITPLQAEVVLHTECIPDKTSTLLGNSAAAYSPGMMTAVSHAVANTDFAHTEDQQESTIGAFVSQVRQSAGERVSHLFSQGAAQVLNYADTQGRGVLNYGLRAGAGYLYNRYINPNRGYQNINGPRLNGILNE